MHYITAGSLEFQSENYTTPNLSVLFPLLFLSVDANWAVPLKYQTEEYSILPNPLIQCGNS